MLFDADVGNERYLFIKNADGTNAKYRAWLEQMWDRCHHILTDDFARSFQNDASKFDAYTWELILHTRLLEHGLELAKPQSSNAPDVTIQLRGSPLYLECVLPTRGDDGKPDSVNTQRPGDVYKVDMDKSILRCTGAIGKKIAQHQSWLEQGICVSDAPFVVALHGKFLELGTLNETLPDIIRAVFPFGAMTVTWNLESDTTETGRVIQPSIPKTDTGNLVATTYFADETYAQVSGLLFALDWGPFYRSCSPYYSYIQNPFATNPIPQEVLSFAQFCYARANDDNGVTVSLEQP